MPSRDRGRLRLPIAVVRLMLRTLCVCSLSFARETAHPRQCHVATNLSDMRRHTTADSSKSGLTQIQWQLRSPSLNDPPAELPE